MNTYLHSDDDHLPDEDPPISDPPFGESGPPPTNVWATLALQAGALRDIAEACKMLGRLPPARLITGMLRQIVEDVMGPDPLSVDFDWSEVPGGTAPTQIAGGKWRIVEVLADDRFRLWYTDNPVTAQVCYAAGYEVYPQPSAHGS